MRLSQLSPGHPEIFATVQGEGLSLGVPSVFVRLSECNLRCGYCDTKYTWDWDNYDREKEATDVAPTDVAAAVQRIAAGAKTVVITGGEPLLQQVDIAEVGAVLKTAGMRIEIETNGAIQPTVALAALVDQWNVSPKLANSGNARSARLRAGPLAWFADASNAVFKFVVESPVDLDEIEALLVRYSIPRERVLLMPEGIDATVIAERGRWLAAECLRRGLRLTTRLHVSLWGQARGR